MIRYIRYMDRILTIADKYGEDFYALIWFQCQVLRPFTSTNDTADFYYFLFGTKILQNIFILDCLTVYSFVKVYDANVIMLIQRAIARANCTRSEFVWLYYATDILGFFIEALAIYLYRYNLLIIFNNLNLNLEKYQELNMILNVQEYQYDNNSFDICFKMLIKITLPKRQS